MSLKKNFSTVVSFVTLVGSVIMLGLSIFSFTRKDSDKIADTED